MKSTQYLLAALLVHAPMSAYPNTGDVNDCKRIENQTLRLACYDRLFEYAASDGETFADRDPNTQEEPETSSDSQATSAADSEFGAENVPTTPENFIKARLVGDFTGWSGKTIFKLDNGQVWQQTNNYIRDYTPRSPIQEPMVTITKGMFGSYNMRVGGIKRIVQVKRIK